MKRIEKEVPEAIRDCMKEKGVSQAKLAEKIGAKSPQVVQSLLYAKNGMRSDKLIELLTAMGYELVIRDKVNDQEIILK